MCMQKLSLLGSYMKAAASFDANIQHMYVLLVATICANVCACRGR